MMPSRLEGIKKQIKSSGLDAFLVSSVSDIAYFTSYSNFSIFEREAYLLITKDFQYIFTDQRYIEAIKNQVKYFEVIDNRSTPFKSTLERLIKKHQIKRLGIDENNLTVLEYKFFKKLFRTLINYNAEDSRIIKSPDEIDSIEKACQLGDKTFDFILKKLKPGVTEKEIAFAIEMFVKKSGATLSFDSTVAFGANSSIPHHQTENKQLEKNSMILLDFGTKVDNYCSDMTRTVFFGKANQKQKQIYQIVLTAQQKAVQFIQNKIKAKKPLRAELVDAEARTYILSKGYSFPHSLGHGVGHEVHERPWVSTKSKDILKPGMVFSIEPGIYIPKFGGVRIEDLYVLKENKLDQITNSPKHLIEI